MKVGNLLPVGTTPMPYTSARWSNELETEGYEAVELREVARRARVSMTTIYRRYPTREALIVGALRWWMDENRYAGVATGAVEQLSGSIHDDLMALFRTIFQPWEQHPHSAPCVLPGTGGAWWSGTDRPRVRCGGTKFARTILQQADPAFASDMEMILSGVIYGLLAQFADGAIAVTDILPALDRAVFWLTVSQDVDAHAHQQRFIAFDPGDPQDRLQSTNGPVSVQSWCAVSTASRHATGATDRDCPRASEVGVPVICATCFTQRSMSRHS